MKTLTGMFAMLVLAIGFFFGASAVLPVEAVAQERQSKSAKYPNDCRRYTPGSFIRARCDCAFKHIGGGTWLPSGGFRFIQGARVSDCAIALMSKQNSAAGR